MSPLFRRYREPKKEPETTPEETLWTDKRLQTARMDIEHAIIETGLTDEAHIRISEILGYGFTINVRGIDLNYAGRTINRAIASVVGDKPLHFRLEKFESDLTWTVSDANRQSRNVAKLPGMLDRQLGIESNAARLGLSKEEHLVKCAYCGRTSITVGTKCPNCGAPVEGTTEQVGIRRE